MAVLHLASGRLTLTFAGSSITSATLRYEVADTAALSKRGTIDVPLSAAVKRQLEQAAADTLRKAKVM